MIYHSCSMMGVRIKAKADSILKTAGLGCGTVVDMEDAHS